MPQGSQTRRQHEIPRDPEHPPVVDPAKRRRDIALSLTIKLGEKIKKVEWTDDKGLAVVRIFIIAEDDLAREIFLTSTLQDGEVIEEVSWSKRKERDQRREASARKPPPGDSDATIADPRGQKLRRRLDFVEGKDKEDEEREGNEEDASAASSRPQPGSWLSTCARFLIFVLAIIAIIFFMTPTVKEAGKPR